MTVETRVWQVNPYRRAATEEGDAADLWLGYTGQRADPGLRDQLILRYAPLVKYVANRLAVFLPAVLSTEDMLSHGTIGLIEAIDRYDPGHGAKFETYAIRRIWGSMIDALRSLSILPRSTTQQVRALDQALAELERDLGRSPTTAEVAAHLGIDETAVNSRLAAANFSLVSLDTRTNGDEDSLTLLDVLSNGADDPTSDVEKQELRAALARAIERLPQRERLVLSLYYQEEMTLKEIGRALKVSESRVSQLHAMAIARLRAALAPYWRQPDARRDGPDWAERMAPGEAPGHREGQSGLTPADSGRARPPERLAWRRTASASGETSASATCVSTRPAGMPVSWRSPSTTSAR